MHAAEVALRVRLVQHATDHLLAYKAGELTAPAWRDCEDELQAWENFTDVVNAALRDFHVRVSIPQEDAPEERALGGVWTTLYSAVMLRLVNDLAAGETFRKCANETCGRAFVRQLGRSHYYSRGEGVRYCSRLCANEQTQRDWRRRKRAERNTNDN